ncbi:hypothetical protein [Sphingomonas morindae]|uniref:Uncharacterized protein n=1 Tax=Sphingomonas morindae TaxID=1541170 RepID=A0ABY4X6I0_9SPHN|nr:hypothetical protein [Sphingomonas morindae]USI72491.1 hypothetical protein LHA26_14525 [Sphingomonas morindae]
MRRRDRAWRAAGAALLTFSCVAGRMDVGGPVAVLAAFAGAVLGVILLVNGHHVQTAMRAERRGHALTAEVIHAARLRRRARPAPRPDDARQP